MTTNFRRALLLVSLVPASAMADSFQSLDAVDARAVEAAGRPVRPVDRRLKLAACPVALAAEPTSPGAVSISCAPLGWRIRLLLENASEAASNAPVIIRRGDPVSVNFVAPGFSVTTSGVAESEARRGERVRVRVEQKTTPVMGEAVDTGTVRVGALN